MRPQLVITVDTETTGIDTKVCEPVQVAATLDAYLGYEPQGHCEIILNSLCSPSVEIEDGAREIHGICEQLVRFSPKPFTVISSLVSLLQEASESGDVIVSTYNGNMFDLPILSRFNMAFNDFPSLDVMGLSLRELSVHGGKLTEVFEGYVGDEADGAHDAAADCLMTSKVLRKYCMENKRSPLQIVQELNVATPYKVFPFGKHKGKPIHKVPKNYVRWCQKNFENVSPDLGATFDEILKGAL